MNAVPVRLAIGGSAAPGTPSARDHASALGPHQPGRYSASSLLARRSARSIAAEKSASTAFLLILRRKKSAHRNSLNGVVLGKTARSPPLAGEAAERIVLQLHNGLRDVGKIPAATLRVEGISQALVVEHGPKGVEVQRAQVEHNGDENVPQSL